jgi:hypothetical protein
MVLTAYSELSPAIGLFVTVASAMREHCRQLDASVEASGPHGFAVRLKRVRLPRRIVHRIPRPTFVTIAKRPSWWARDGAECAGDLPDDESEIFLRGVLDSRLGVDRASKIRFWRKSMSVIPCLSFRGASKASEPGIHSAARKLGGMDSGLAFQAPRNDGECVRRQNAHHTLSCIMRLTAAIASSPNPEGISSIPSLRGATRRSNPVSCASGLVR